MLDPKCIVTMGKTDSKQSKLQFDVRRSTKLTADTAGPPEAAKQLLEELRDDMDMKMLLIAMKANLTSIEAKMGTMCTRINKMAHKLESQDGLIQEVER
ncbi:hypothetical protein NDU88_006323 [Pleurodeles waltl]|uniref:Uncharacterized protein n=1 Tax=Pleurodeles waltl TaxID=8319 RepID=A0AAV7VPH3_PLEWA|nr:hypothetical protein NDU88_006323 [Pleurodeles waltl]